MPKFTIQFDRTVTFNGYLTIESPSEDEAEVLANRLAKEMHIKSSIAEEFHNEPSHDIEWELDSDDTYVTEILED